MKVELTFHNHENAFKTVQKLVEENYAVLISKEEDLIILNYEIEKGENE